MIAILAISFALIFLFLAYKRLDWAFFITLAALPAYLIRFNIGPLPSTLLEIMILATFGGWFINNFKGIKDSIQKKTKKIQYPYTIEVILLIIISFISLIPSNFSMSSLGIWRAYFFEPLLFFIVAANLFTKKENREKFMYAIAISALVASILAIYQKLTGNLIDNPFWADSATRRVTSFFSYPNALGLYLAPIASILAIMGLKEIEGKNYKKALAYLSIFMLSAASIYFAKSDGGIIGLVAAAFVAALLYRPWSRKAVIVFTIIALEAIWLSPYKQAAIDKVTLFDLSGQIRKQQWIETYNMLRSDNNWILGAGLDNYQEKIAPFHQDGIFVENHDPNWYNKVVWDDEYKKQVWQPTEIYKYPHNFFLNFWSELGLAGMLLFIWLVFKFIYQSIAIWRDKEHKNNRYYGLAMIAAMTAIFVHGLVDVPYFKNDLSVFFLVLFALSGVIYMENKNVWKKE